MTIISTAVFKTDAGEIQYFEPRRENDMTTTQARKAAARYWGGRTEREGKELLRVCVVEVQGMILRAHEKHDGRWMEFMPPEDAAGYIKACIDLAGGRPTSEFVPPETLEINGYLYRLDI